MMMRADPKRLLIYFFYDKDGIVDRYIPYLLEDMKKNVSEICFVSNGKLEQESRKKIEGLAERVIERANVGFDVWAYKEALESYGFEALAEAYDEVILMNDTIMGPVYPFKEMFDRMDRTDVDFWGLTKCRRTSVDSFGTTDDEGDCEYLQSHFTAIRSSMIRSADFVAYWKEMPSIQSREEANCLYESEFTDYFANLGFRWESYIDTKGMEKLTHCGILYAPVRLIEEKRCPVFKRRSFFYHAEVLSNSMGEAPYELMQYLQKKTSYDTDMIWENILRRYPMAEIKNALHLNYILPTDVVKKKEDHIKIALVFHAYFMDLLDSTYSYVNSMPSDADVFITVGSEQKKALVEKRFEGHKFHRLEVRLIENRGRDVSALLVGVKDVVMDYDYVCFAHDKKVMQFSVGSIGASFAYQCLEGTLTSEGYVHNVVELFEKNPRLGLVTPPPPFHADYFPTVGNAWGPNFEITREVAKLLDLNVPIQKDSYPIAPLGTMFWFRTKGMKKLFDRDWEYRDFPKEPNNTDGTLLHAIERVYNLVEQDAGFYSAYCVPTHLASILMTNYSYTLAGYVRMTLEAGPYDGRYVHMTKFVQSQLNAKKAIRELTASLPDLLDDPLRARNGLQMRGSMRLYYSQKGIAFSEKCSLSILQNANDASFSLDFGIPEDAKNVSCFRFDPEEFGNVCLENLKIQCVGKDGSIYEPAVEELHVNGVVSSGAVIFLDRDPQILWSLPDTLDASEVRISGNINRNFSSADLSMLLRAAGKESVDTIKLYYGHRFSFAEERAVSDRCKMSGSAHVEFVIPDDGQPIDSLRLDPGEGANLRVDSIRGFWIDQNGGTHRLSRFFATNGISHKGKLLFFDEDPWLMWSVPGGKRPVKVIVEVELTSGVRECVSHLVGNGRYRMLKKLKTKFKKLLR